MKKIISVLFTIISICVSVSSTAQTTFPSPDPCPPGFHPLLHYECSEFNFHRPKRNCNSGFFICISGCSWEVTCVEDPIWQPATISGTKVSAWADLLEKKVRFRFPIGLNKVSGYSATDLQTFNVDDALILDFGIKKVKLIVGDYKTSVSESEITVEVPFAEVK